MGEFLGEASLFRNLMEAVPDAMVVADEAGRIVLVNCADRTDVRLSPRGTGRPDR